LHGRIDNRSYVYIEDRREKLCSECKTHCEQTTEVYRPRKEKRNVNIFFRYFIPGEKNRMKHAFSVNISKSHG